MKKCPRCDKNHDKLGLYCSRSCANVRIWSQEINQERSKKLRKHLEKKCPICSINFLPKNSKIKTCSGKCGNTLRWQSIDEREKYSLLAKDRKLGGHTSKTKIYYKKVTGEEVYLQSSYEIRLAEILDDLGILWERPEPFYWKDEFEKTHRYYPDFKINEMFIDTKNDYLALKDKSKIEKVRLQNDINLIILTNDYINREYIASLVQR